MTACLHLPHTVWGLPFRFFLGCVAAGFVGAAVTIVVDLAHNAEAER